MSNVYVNIVRIAAKAVPESFGCNTLPVHNNTDVFHERAEYFKFFVCEFNGVLVDADFSAINIKRNASYRESLR